MKTSSFFQYHGPGRISIAVYAPRGTPAGYRIFKPLAPLRSMLKMSDMHEYRELYHAHVLSKLNPEQTWEKIHELAAPHEPVLLCWEDIIRKKQWCHRRMVADWFKATLGHEVYELQPNEL